MSSVIILLNILLISLLLIAAVIVIWRVASTRRAPTSLCLFFILPVGQLFMLYSFSFEQWSLYWLFGVLLGLVANILLLTYTISQERKTAALEELRETRYRIELEKSHYEIVAERIGELEKMCTDFNAKLEAVANLARSGEDAIARDSIAALAERINRTKENPYCNIPVINAILTEKEKDCAAAGIVLSVDLKLPDALTVEPMHLCSIFSNILDNAIAACRKIQGMDKPVIRLSSLTDGDYLVIKSVNPSVAPTKPAPGRGYGTRILTELAAKYDGDHISEYKNGVFTVLLSLTAEMR
jgi:signal transduction histidine kinase